MCHTLAAGVRFGPWEGACSQCGQGRVPPPANCLGIVGGRLRQEVKLKTWWLEGRRGQHANGVEAEAAGGAQGHLAVAATIPAVIHLDGEARFLWRHTSAHTSFSEKKNLIYPFLRQLVNRLSLLLTTHQVSRPCLVAVSLGEVKSEAAHDGYGQQHTHSASVHWWVGWQRVDEMSGD